MAEEERAERSQRNAEGVAAAKAALPPPPPPSHLVVVGGGVAGVSAAEELCRIAPRADVTLVSADADLRGAATVARLGRALEEVRLEARAPAALAAAAPNLRWVRGTAVGLDLADKRLLLDGGISLPYDALIVATGARPRRLLADGGAAGSPRVLALRDTDSVAALAGRLAAARRVLVAGNGGIALELAAALRGPDLVWAARHCHVGDAFFDADAAAFLLEELRAGRGAAAAASASDTGNGAAADLDSETPVQAQAQAPAAPLPPQVKTTLGRAVGPRWAEELLPRGARAGTGRLMLELGCEVARVEERAADPSAPADADAAFPVLVTLSSGARHAVDFVVTAIGVDPAPALEWVPHAAARGADGGLAVDARMATTAPGVFAAGDAASAEWPRAAAPHWFQMRLWAAARAMGVHAARCAAGVDAATGTPMAFELFSHVTRFAGKKVVLLGLYNGQRLEGEPAEEMVSYSRVDEEESAPAASGGCCGSHGVHHGGAGRRFVRVLLLRGRVQGAVLVGETGLEEVMENLILDQLDVSALGPALLDPDLELDHVFD
jgi:NADPH-dependent 2,4-dienoyl-CoA reductase/sulfur reductase-like enzyme